MSVRLQTLNQPYKDRSINNDLVYESQVFHNETPFNNSSSTLLVSESINSMNPNEFYNENSVKVNKDLLQSRSHIWPKVQNNQLTPIYVRSETFNEESVAVQPKPLRNAKRLIPMSEAKNKPPRDWNFGLFECCDDAYECVMVTCFPEIYAAIMSIRAKEILSSLCFGGLVPIRTKIREERKIKGTIFSDCCTVTFCPWCSLVQMNMETKFTEPLI